MRADPRLTHGEAIARKRQGIVYVMRGGVIYERNGGRK